MLGLPPTITACLFDLDGVLTQTSVVHAAAWKETFDAFLRRRAERAHEAFVPFDPVNDYRRYVDGKPRADGVSSFLAARAIALPRGRPDDPPAAETVNGLGNRKRDLVLAKIREAGVAVYAGSATYARAVRAAGVPQAVVSSSANAVPVLKAAGLLDLFDVCIDGLIAAERGLQGKPAPDTFLEAARALQRRTRPCGGLRGRARGCGGGTRGRLRLRGRGRPDRAGGRVA